MKYPTPLSCLDWEGNRVPSDSFTSRLKGEKPLNMPPIVLHQEIPDIDDGDKYEWVQIGDSKYGRNMLCNKTGIVRSQTMGEFYGNSTVD